MSYNGSGTFLINTAGQPVVSGTVISSTAFNALTADLATGLSTAITKDGQTTVTANIPMSTYKFTGLGAGSAATDSANLSQVQSTVSKLLNTITGTNTITATASPTLSAYAAGQMFYFVAAGDNTTSVTLNIDGLGAKAVTRDGSTALISGDIKSGEVVVVVYDGTRFQVVSQVNSAGDATFANVSITSALNVGGVATFTSNPVLSGGTANGVLYLNGSKVATSGSALTFDGTNLNLNSGTAVSATSGGSVTAGVFAARAPLNAHQTAAGILQYSANETTLRSYGATGVTGALVFNLGAGGSADAEYMRLTTTGLGLGTTSPTLYAGYTTLAVNNATNGGLIDLLTNGTRVLTMYAGSTSVIGTVNASNLAFITNNAERARFDTNGNLGIGTTSPTARVHAYSGTAMKQLTVDGTGAIKTGINFASGGTTYGQIYFDNNSPYDMSVVQQYTTGSLIFGTNSTERARISSGGDFLVGTTSTSSVASAGFKVVVGGGGAGNPEIYTVSGASTNASSTYMVYSTGAAAYRFYVGLAGTIFATNTTISAISDRRLKENIRDLDAGLDAIMALKPRKFDWKEGKGKDIKNDHGFIAQEFEQVFPDLIDTWKDPAPEGEEPYKSVRQDLIPVLVKAIQELKAELDALKGAK